jgi:phospholipid/cholesterol/gamma-HCH transport system substrate-binding protein
VSNRGRLAEIKVGAFVLVALAILIFGSLWIAGSTFFGAPRVSYKVLMKDSVGLQAGDRVRINGVSVGRVQHVSLRPGDEWPVTLRVALKPDIPIKDDSSATVGTSGLLGASYLEIAPGSPGADPLPEGGEIRGTASAGLNSALARVDQIADKTVGLLDQLTGLLDTVDGELGPILGNLERMISEDNAENFQQTLANLRGATDDLGPRVSSLLEQLDTMAGQVEDGLEGLPGLRASLDALVADLHAAVGPDGERLARVLESAETSLNRADETLSVLGGNRGEIEATLRDLRDTLANLKAFSQLVKERPYSLVRVKPEPQREPGDGVKESSR